MPDRSVAAESGPLAAMAPAPVTGPLLRCSGVDGLAREFNSAWLSYTGRPLQSVLRDGWLDDVHPDDRPRCVAIHAAMSNQRRAYALDFRLRNGAGYRWMLEHVTPLLRPDGTFSYRFSLPDGRYELPAVATSADGTDSRSAGLEFSRSTEYRGDVGNHPVPQVERVAQAKERHVRPKRLGKILENPLPRNGRIGVFPQRRERISFARAASGDWRERIDIGR